MLYNDINKTVHLSLIKQAIYTHQQAFVNSAECIYIVKMMCLFTCPRLSVKRNHIDIATLKQADYQPITTTI